QCRVRPAAPPADGWRSAADAAPGEPAPASCVGSPLLGRLGYTVHYWSNLAPRLWPLERPRQCGVTPGLCRLPAPDQSGQSPGRTAAWDKLPHRSHTGYSSPECLAFRVPGIRERLPFARYAPLHCGVRRGYYALAPLVNFSLRCLAAGTV